MKQVFPQILKNILRFFLIMQTFPSVFSIIESMCTGTGFFNLDSAPPGLTGPRDIGWKRLYAHNKPWTHAFWGLTASSSISTGEQFGIRVTLLKDASTGTILNGWLYLHIYRNEPFHYLAAWAVTESNEVYGQFVYDKNLKLDKSCDNKPYYYADPNSYIPCSAAPINCATVPNTFIYANLVVKPSGHSEAETATSSRPRHKRISLVWRAPCQRYCQRPEKFRFIVAVSGIGKWEKDWNTDWTRVTQPPGKMKDQKDWAPFIQATHFIHPDYFGHASRHDTHHKELACGIPLNTGIIRKTDWVLKVETSLLEYQWQDKVLWTPSSPDGNWQHPSVIFRSTCKASSPDVDVENGFGGRCTSKVDGTKYVSAARDVRLECSDAASPLGRSAFQDDYEDYLTNLEERLKGACECVLVVDHAINTRSLPLFLPSGVREVKEDADDNAIHNNEVCAKTIDKLSAKQQVSAGICVHNKVGTLVYGVRQWHGVTSLGVTLIITPLSIFIARYNKGEMILIEGKVPLKGWYISHILLVFPAIWMYSSGFATISRQKDVLGYSYTWAAHFHRTLGMVTFLLIPLQFITGFLRPTNLTLRKVFIFIHWVGGITQHILELILCIFSSQIPASPTSSKSLTNPEFGQLSSSIVACLILGWFGFSTTFHILLMIRIKRRDCLEGVGSRSVFPIIIPLLSTAARDDLDLGHLQKDIWFERGALLIFSLVSCIVFAVSIVSLYQALYDNLYYGFGPMSCTHSQGGILINSTGGGNLCSH